MDKNRINNIIKEINLGETFIGEYLDVKSILEVIYNQSIFIPNYKLLKIYKPYDDYIIEPYILV